MKTKRVRPVLVESKDIHSQLEIDNIYINKLSYELKQYHCKHPQELILISLEDEKIEVGDEFIELDIYKTRSSYINKIYICDVGNTETFILTKDINFPFPENCKKIIARQSQIPLEYISKFIEQYNKGCIEDLEIEMEKCWINSDNVKGNSFTEVAKFEPSINDFDAVLIIQPKLTNGFVTIVEKEPIIYTEEEVRKLISEALYHFCPMNNHRKEDEIDWFENNKKK